MKKIIKDYSIVPEQLQKCQFKINTIISRIVEKRKVKIGNCYKKKDVKQKLSELYNNKCAFCETDPTVSSYWEVEHYRPKGKIDKEPKHKGYYWLAYEWSNLLYACKKCNIKKATKFPITGIRVKKHPEISGKPDFSKFKANSIDLENEKPLILNPEKDDFNPSKHFQINKDGEMIGLTEKGVTTIEICDLNRFDLCVKRKKVIDDINFIIDIYVSLYIDKEIKKASLKEKIKKVLYSLKNKIEKDKKLEYTFFQEKIISDFDKLFIARKPELKEELTEIYSEFKHKNKTL